MPRASELKRGHVIALGGIPHVVDDLSIQTPSARGGASLYKFRFRNLVTRQKEDRTLKGDDLLDSVSVERCPVQLSYRQGDAVVFMDLEDFSEYAVNTDDIEEQSRYLTEGMEDIVALVSDGRVLTIELPDVAELAITACDPSVRGASATARTKPATLSTGLVVQVPEYLSQGEVIRVDTRTGKFLSRA
jgi:elongation factor P